MSNRLRAVLHRGIGWLGAVVHEGLSNSDPRPFESPPNRDELSMAIETQEAEAVRQAVTRGPKSEDAREA